MIGWLRNLFGSRRVSKDAEREKNLMADRFIRLKAKYDAAQSDNQANHWTLADMLGPNAANSVGVRNVLRKRCRYEIANNSYAKGVVLTWANELVGRGPRLQMRLAEKEFAGAREANRRTEQLFSRWMMATGFAEKLHTFVQSTVGDGEGQAIITANPRVMFPVKLDLSLIEPDQFTTNTANVLNPNAVDGIEFDAYGNPEFYHVLKYHPGEAFAGFGANAYRRIPARFFLHWFRVDRPGQARGIPWIIPSLGLFAQLRRWTLAVLTGAETAANFAAILTTDAGVDNTTQADPWDEVEIQMGAMTTLPAGWKMSQFMPTQPVATYDQFKRELLKEIARCLNMPSNVVAGDSSLYNYASGRLDYQNWHRAVRVARASLERTILEHVFHEWLIEAAAARLLPSGIDVDDLPHGWFWDAVQHVDPIKDGTGDSLALANNTDTLANLCAAQGMDWEEVLEQRGQEVARMREHGLDIFLPDFAMNVQKEIATTNDTGGEADAKGSLADYFSRN